MKKLYLQFTLILLSINMVTAKEYRLQSPDNKQSLILNVNETLTLQVFHNGQQVLNDLEIGLQLAQKTLGHRAEVVSIKHEKIRSVEKPLYGKNKILQNHYNSLKMNFRDGFGLELRAYDEGLAYRFFTTLTGSVNVVNEILRTELQKNAAAILPLVENYTSWEVPYHYYKSLNDIGNSKRALTPSLFFSADQSVKTIIAEAGVYDYPGMYVNLSGSVVKGEWAAYPKETVMGSWGNFVSVVKEREPYIAKIEGSRTLPWRFFVSATNDKDLLNNELVYLLNVDGTRKNNYSWVKPGKAVWEWWHDAMLTANKIPSGMDNRNTALYNYYVDFAGQQGVEYMMIDAGWSNVYDLKKPNPKVDIKEVIQRAKKQNVEVLLWCVATTLLNDLDKNLDYIKSLGSAGIKVDFFDRDDQLATKSMEIIAEAAAKRQLVVNFHGCTKPSGWNYRYPNVLNYEAVRGEECAKWDYTSDPDYHLYVPFIRMIAGPLDYTPGSMRNMNKQNFKPVDPGLPMTMGTKAHELSLFLLFDQPLAMMSDSPDEYRRYPDILSFLSKVPTTFDETKALDAKVGEYIVLAKKKKDVWYVGLSTNWKGKTLEVDFSFLPKGKYRAKIIRDNINNKEDYSSYIIEEKTLDRNSKLSVTCLDGGGAVLELTPIK